ncbi:MAG: hypothetical protein Harvfovirus22_22 [Harvfovirus sp.]|uniref:Uncharacterized protein n=1 Tax=Harvfovirus sp. TaxID=2487768 RepID=A0A3G5A1Z8_9VIRU|nr:MAG: hypothetical protein Harvfovirus22_22 [Harvfovirus sp.]
MNDYSSMNTLRKYSCLIIIPCLIISLLLIIWGITENNFITTTEYAFPEKTTIYNITVSNNCQLGNSTYPLCENQDENGNNDKCSVMNSCSTNYYKCGFCSRFETSRTCRNAIMYDFTWNHAVGRNEYPYNWCRKEMFRAGCIDTTKSNRHDSLSFRCSIYPNDGIIYCNRRCGNFGRATYLYCFQEDTIANCTQKVCDFTRNYYYQIHTRYGFIQDGQLHYTHKYRRKNCQLNDSFCVTNQMNNRGTSTIYYDKNEPRSVIYSSPDAISNCNTHVTRGIIAILILTYITTNIFEKSKEHSECLITQQREEIIFLQQAILQSQLSPPIQAKIE